MSTSRQSGSNGHTSDEEMPPSQQVGIETDQLPAPEGRGMVLAIGGAEEKSADGDILRTFVRIAGGNDARVAIVPTASAEPQDVANTYAGTLREMGVRDIRVLKIERREEANEAQALDVFDDVTGIFITGGEQARLMELIIGTAVMDSIRERHRAGAIVAGTSAGASIVAEHTISGMTGVDGRSGESAARKGLVEVAKGLGVFPAVVLDQHFSERGRLGRLLSAYAANPGLVAIGLDEDTAALFNGTNEFQACGSGMVTVIAGRNSTSDYYEREPGEVVTVLNAELHALAAGRRFNLLLQTPVFHQEKAPAEVS